jgi:hypothetical protein
MPLGPPPSYSARHSRVVHAFAWSDKCPTERKVDVPDPEEPVDLDTIKRRRAYRAQRYDTDIAATVSDAREWVERRADKVTKRALVLDVDDGTSLSNRPYRPANNFGFILDAPANWFPKGSGDFNAWILRHLDEPVAPARPPFNAAKVKGVSVFFITRRAENQRRVANFNLIEPDTVRGPCLSGVPSATRTEPSKHSRLRREAKPRREASISSQISVFSGATLMAGMRSAHSVSEPTLLDSVITDI